MSPLGKQQSVTCPFWLCVSRPGRGVLRLLVTLRDDPGQFVNRAEDPAYAAKVRHYAQKMLDWRLSFAERTLTGVSSGCR